MELTWPIDTYCWISFWPRMRWNIEVNMQICLSYAPNYEPNIVFHLGDFGDESMIIDTTSNCFKVLGFGEDAVIKHWEYLPDFTVAQATLDEDLANHDDVIYIGGEDQTMTNHLDVGQRIVAAIRTLPMPIADEIIPHLRGSIRTVLAEIS